MINMLLSYCARSAAWSCVFCVALTCLPAQAQTSLDSSETSPWTSSLETWVYTAHNNLNAGSAINPGNQVFKIPQQQFFADARLNAKGDFDAFEAILDARLVADFSKLSSTSVTGGQRRTTDSVSAELLQGIGRWKRGGSTLVVGREVLTWGPASFRSPSNPFYFDSGRTQPLASTPGVDLVRFTQGFNEWRLTAAHVFSSGQLEPSVQQAHSSLLKLDYQGTDHLLSMNVVNKAQQPTFWGGFFQYTPSDAWLLYAEHGSGNPKSNLGRSTSLGGSYTLEGGQVISGEWLQHNGGLSRRDELQFFDQVVAGYSAGVPFSADKFPRLIGKQYLWLGLQSNPQESQSLWRAEFSRNQTDGSGQLMFYFEKNLNPRLSAFLLVRHGVGDAKTEFGSLIRTHATVGLKVFVF